MPRDVASRAAKERCDKGYGVNNTGLAVFLDFSEAINRLGKDVVAQRYGNLFDMYEEITDVSPYENPMMIYPAIHYTMGGIWVDYELMTSIKGLFAIGECNFSDTSCCPTPSRTTWPTKSLFPASPPTCLSLQLPRRLFRTRLTT